MIDKYIQPFKLSSGVTTGKKQSRVADLLFETLDWGIKGLCLFFAIKLLVQFFSLPVQLWVSFS